MRMMQRWAKQPVCATLTIASGATGSISFVSTKINPDRVFVSSGGDAGVIWSTTTDPTAIADPATGVVQANIGKRFLQANVTQPFEVAGGAKVWYFKNLSAGSITLQIEAGFASAGMA